MNRRCYLIVVMGVGLIVLGAFLAVRATGVRYTDVRRNIRIHGFFTLISRVSSSST